MKEHGARSLYAVICKTSDLHKTPMRVFMTEEEYNRQMDRPNSLWQCPLCMNSADWDDDNFEKAIGNTL